MRAAITALKPIDDSLTTRAEMIARWKEASSRIKAAGITYGKRVEAEARGRFSEDIRTQVIHSIGLRTNTSSVTFLWNGVVPPGWQFSTGLGKLRAADVVAAVCQTMRITRCELLGPRRMVRITNARAVAYYVMREHTMLSLPQIGKLMGGKDHSTVMNGINNVEVKRRRTLWPLVRAIEAALGVC